MSISGDKIDSLIDLGRFEMARKELSRALGTDPDNTSLQLVSARLNIHTDQHDQALKDAEKVLSTEPDNPAAGFYRFRALEGLKRYGDAEQGIIDLIRIFPESGMFYAAYSSLMLETGNPDKAMRLAREAYRLDPDNHQCVESLIIVSVVTGDVKKVSPLIEKLIRENPDNTRTLSLLLARLVEEGRFDKAAPLSRLLVQHLPRDEKVVNLAVEVAVAGHWTMKPFSVLSRYGWMGSGLIWAGALGVIYLTRRLPPEYALAGMVFLWAYILWCIASWVWPPVLKNYLTRKGLT